MHWFALWRFNGLRQPFSLSAVKGQDCSRLDQGIKRDGWTEEARSGETRGFVKQSIDGTGRKRVVIHFHPKKQYGPRLIRYLVRDIGWSDEDLRRLEMIQ